VRPRHKATEGGGGAAPGAPPCAQGEAPDAPGTDTDGRARRRTGRKAHHMGRASARGLSSARPSAGMRSARHRRHRQIAWRWELRTGVRRTDGEVQLHAGCRRQGRARACARRGIDVTSKLLGGGSCGRGARRADRGVQRHAGCRRQGRARACARQAVGATAEGIGGGLCRRGRRGKHSSPGGEQAVARQRSSPRGGESRDRGLTGPARRT